MNPLTLRFDASLSHAQSHLKLLDELNVRYLMGGDAVQPSIEAFDLDFPQMQQGQVWAVAHSEANDEVAELVEDFADRGADLLLLRLPPKQYLGR